MDVTEAPLFTAEVGLSPGLAESAQRPGTAFAAQGCGEPPKPQRRGENFVERAKPARSEILHESEELNFVEGKLVCWGCVHRSPHK